MRHVVEVNEGVVEASRQGIDWWQMFRIQFRSCGRLTEVVPACVIGGTVHVACDSKDDAAWLAQHMVEFGNLPRTAVKAKAMKS